MLHRTVESEAVLKSFSSREFNQDVSHAKRVAVYEPVFVTDRGTPTHVLLSIDVEKTGLAPNRRILPVRQQDKDFPMSWIRRYEKGRVFYSAIGHGPHIFWNADRDR